MISDPANPDAWFILAKDRLEKADALYEQFGASWSGVELLQEAAERYLKRFLGRARVESCENARFEPPFGISLRV
jgi:hypothetical protein